jgi:UDP-N-acetylglucosamine--N-acetylmuramyl-(pentapeptide) pyrophosphoryl-undecaprenol N-acetylglucosamine transferase
MAVLDALRAHEGLLEDVRFFGPEDRGERAAVEARGLRFEAIPAAGVRGRGPVALARSLARLGRGTLLAVRRLRAFDPDAVFSTGGYASFPCSVAARLLRRPLVVYLPDVTPGWAVRVEQRLATRIATTTEAALAHLPRRKTVVTGYPVRAEFFASSREDARRALGLPPGEPVLVVAGATQGAHAINQAVFDALPRLLEAAFVIHVTGKADLEDACRLREPLEPRLRDRYHVAAYREDLPAVMLAADLGIFRAGASVLGEIPAAGLPALFVPGGYAGGHQRENAEWLAKASAAEVIDEAAIGDLAPRALALLREPARLAAMGIHARALARPDAAAAIGRLVVEVARR